MAYIVAWRSGEVEVLRAVPEGALKLMTGPRKQLEKILVPVARHAHDGKTLLVPGVPEADSDETALEAVVQFQVRLNLRAIRRAS